MMGGYVSLLVDGCFYTRKNIAVVNLHYFIGVTVVEEGDTVLVDGKSRLGVPREQMRVVERVLQNLGSIYGIEHQYYR